MCGRPPPLHAERPPRLASLTPRLLKPAPSTVTRQAVTDRAGDCSAPMKQHRCCQTVRLTGAGVVVEVAIHHGLHVDGGAQQAADAVDLAAGRRGGTGGGGRRGGGKGRPGCARAREGRRARAHVGVQRERRRKGPLVCFVGGEIFLGGRGEGGGRCAPVLDGAGGVPGAKHGVDGQLHLQQGGWGLVRW